MSERPILFSGAMVRAILAGRKAQTRRVIRPQPPHGVGRYPSDSALRCPYGEPGDLLWIRETWAPLGDKLTKVIGRPRVFRADADLVRDDSGDRVGWWLGETFLEGSERPFRWRPSLKMPRWASRITLEVTEVRVQRLQEITEEDAIAEGIEELDGEIDEVALCAQAASMGACAEDARAWFATLWQQINGKRPGCSWGDNPWVWAVSFRRVWLAPWLAPTEPNSTGIPRCGRGEDDAR